MIKDAEKRFLTDADSAPSAIEVAKTFPKIPALAAHGTRCGKPNCRCNRGQLHGPAVYLRWREDGRQRRRYVRRNEVETVRAIINRRRQERALERLIRAEDLALLRCLDRLCREVDAARAENGRNQ